MPNFTTPEDAQAYWELFAKYTHDSIVENKGACSALKLELDQLWEELSTIKSSQVSQHEIDKLWDAIEAIRSDISQCQLRHFHDNKQSAIDVTKLASDVAHQNKTSNIITSTIISFVMAVLMLLIGSYFTNLNTKNEIRKSETKIESQIEKNK